MAGTRTVNVRLLVSSSQFNQGMLAAGSSVRVLATSLGTTAQQAQDANERLADLARAAAVSGGVMAGGFAFVAKTFMDFDKQMSAAGAAAGATGDELQSLREAAIQAGKDTSFSASEAAQGIEELAKAGVSAADITGGALTGALNLAAAGGIDVAEAAETAASAMTVFGLSGQSVGHIADVLAAGAGKAQGGVHEMSQAFQQSSLVAKQTGLTLEDTAGALAMFASNGLIGSDAGTSFKTMLMSLNPRSKEAAQLIEDLGIKAYDQAGNFIGLAAYADRLQKGLGDLSVEQRNAAMQTIFGTDAIRAASIMYNEGSAGVLKWTDAVNDTGYAAEQGAARLDNLAGDIERLKGSIESAILESGSGANNVLRELTQHATNVVNGFAALPGPLQETAVGMAGVAGPALAAAGAMGLVWTKMTTLQTTLMAGGNFAQSMSGAVGFLKGGMLAAIPIIGAAAVALDYYGRKQAEAKQRVEDFTQALQADNGAIGESTKKVLAKTVADSDAAKAAKLLGLTTADLQSAILGNADAQAKVTAATKAVTDAVTAQQGTVVSASSGWQRSTNLLDQAAKSTGGVSAEMENAAANVNTFVGQQTSALDAAQKEWDQQVAALNAGTNAQQQHAKVVAAATDAMNQQADAADALKKMLDNLNATTLDVEQSHIDFLDAIDKVKSGMHDTVDGVDVLTTSLDINSEAGRQNRANVLDAIKAAQDYAVATTQQTHSVDEGVAAYENNIGTLFAQLAAMGLNEDQLNDLRQAVVSIPELKQILIEANTQAAQQAIDSFVVDNSGRQIPVTLQPNVSQAQMQGIFDSMSPDSLHAASGGRVTGPGTSTSDSIPAMLSDDEYVVKASAARAFGYDKLDAINGGKAVMTPMVSYVSYRTSTSSTSAGSVGAGQDDLLSEVVALRQAVDQQTAVLAGVTEKQTRTLSRTSGLERRSGT